jgi:hypothetical protein
MNVRQLSFEKTSPTTDEFHPLPMNLHSSSIAKASPAPSSTSHRKTFPQLTIKKRKDAEK